MVLMENLASVKSTSPSRFENFSKMCWICLVLAEQLPPIAAQLQEKERDKLWELLEKVITESVLVKQVDPLLEENGWVSINSRDDIDEFQLFYFQSISFVSN